METANCALTIGGRIKRADIARLADAIENEGAALDWDDYPDAEEIHFAIETCATAKEPLRLSNSNKPWGKYEEVEALCRELGLTYVLEYEAGGEWHPAMQYRSPDMDADTVLEWPITEIGCGPLMDIEDIQKHLDTGTLERELELMRQVQKFPWPLEIVEDEPKCAAPD
jgi:hypothetical protein